MAWHGMRNSEEGGTSPVTVAIPLETNNKNNKGERVACLKMFYFCYSVG